MYTASRDDSEATARYLANLDPGHNPYKYLVSITQAAVVLDSRPQRLGLRDSHRPARPNRRRWAAPPRASQSAARLPSAPIPPDTTHADPAPTWEAFCPSSLDAHQQHTVCCFITWVGCCPWLSSKSESTISGVTAACYRRIKGSDHTMQEHGLKLACIRQRGCVLRFHMSGSRLVIMPGWQAVAMQEHGRRVAAARCIVRHQPAPVATCAALHLHCTVPLPLPSQPGTRRRQ